MGLVLQGIGGASGIFGAIQGMHNQKWLQGGLTDILNKMGQYGYGPGMDIFNTYSGPLGQNAIGQQNMLMGQLGNAYPDVQGRIQNLQNQIPDWYTNMSGWGNPFSGAATQGQLSLSDFLGGPMNTAAQAFGSGGWTPQYQQGFDQLGGFNQQMNPGLASYTGRDVANEMLDTRGRTNMTDTFGMRGMEGLNAGGMTPTLQAANGPLGALLGAGGNTQAQDMLRGFGGSLLGQTMQNGGMTPGLAGAEGMAMGGFGAGGATPGNTVGEGVALGGLLGQGQTPYTQGLQGLGMGLASQPSLMSPEQATSMARDQAATDMRQQAEHMRAQALARGGGPGATVANGAQNQALADFADEGQRSMAQARQQALMQQQGLQLQQAGMGANMTEAGGGMENQRLGTFGNLLGSMEGSMNNRLGTYGGLLPGLEGVAAQRYGTGLNAGSGMLQGAEGLNNSRLLGGLGMLPELQGAANQNMNILGNLGLGAGNLENNRIGTANNMALGMGQLNLGGLNSWNNMMGNQNQYALGAGGLMNNMAGTQGNIFNSMFGNQMASGQLGLSQLNNMVGGLQQGHSNLTNAGNMGFNALNQTWNPLLSLAGQGMDLWRTGIGGLPSIFGGQGQALTQSPWSSMISMAGGGR